MHRRPILTFTVLYFAICAFYFAWSVAVTEPGYPLDDSWIYQVFARNIATGHGFSFNPDTPIAGATAPLWTLILAALWPMTGPIAGALILGVLLEWLALIAVYKIALILTEDEGLASWLLVLCASCWVLIWGALSGMEVGLYSALSLWGLYFYLKIESFEHPQNYLIYLMFALAVVSRPECAMFLAAVIARDFHEWLHMPRRTLVPWLGRAAAVAIVLAPYLAFNHSTTGSLFPQTFRAKTEEHGFFSALFNGDIKRVIKSLSVYPYVYLQDFLVRMMILAPLLVIPLVSGAVKLVSIRDRLTSKRIMLGALVALYVPLMGAISPVRIGGTYHHMRLMDNIIPLALLIGLLGLFGKIEGRECPGRKPFVLAGLALSLIGGMMILAHREIVIRAAPYLVQDLSHYTATDFAIQSQLVCDTGRNIVVLGFIVVAGAMLCSASIRARLNSRPLRPALLSAMLAYFSIFAILRAGYYANDVKNVNEMDKGVGQYLGRLDGARSVAANDIGAIAYFSGLRMLDLKGLISPEITPAMIRDDSLAFEYMYRHDRVDYVAIFPIWFKYIPKRTDVLKPVKLFIIGRNTILAGDTTIVYRAEWPDTNVDAPAQPR